ncbi:MAG: peptidoglycan-associated lipoprotein [Parvicellaceae bacterium]|jgi:peptidoglycan-associated lipoprotein
MKLLRRIAAVLVISLISFGAYSQKNFTKEADGMFMNERFFSAIDAYKKAETKEKKPAEKARINFQIGECYRMLVEPTQAETYYKRAIKLKYQKTNPLVVFQMAEVLKEEGHYKEAKEEYEKFLVLKPGFKMAEDGLSACSKSEEWINNPTRHKVSSELQLNTEKYDFAPVFADKKYTQMIFSSSRPGSTGAEIDDRTGESFMDLWLTTRDNNGKWSEPKPMTSAINTDDNEGSAAFNRKMDGMYFTRCPREKKSNIGCDIMFTEKQGSNWKPGKSIGLKPEGGDTITIGHPTLSTSDMIMIFASDLPGGKGGKDLWISKWDRKEKKWLEASNLGGGINTSGDEMFPYLKDDGSLYFSSTGHIGMGGLDMFKAEKTGEEQWGNIANLGYPLNSSEHDFGIIFDRGDTEKGFFTSSRADTKGHDDIYSFRLPNIVFTLEVVVKNKATSEPVPGATIVLVGTDGSTITKTTDETGSFKFDEENNKRYVNKQINYSVQVSKEDYLQEKGAFSTMDRTKGQNYLFEYFIQPASKDVVIDFPEVRYDLDKWALQVNEGINSKDSLDYLFTTLTENPSIVVELQSHTDCRGSDNYNQKLSQKRAQSCVDYLVTKGIPTDRMVPVGYGEKQPRVGLECKKIDTLPSKQEQEAAHQKNRRTQFRVLSFDYKQAGGTE